MTEARIVLTSCPASEFGRIAEALLKRRLVACATALGAGESLYWWQGRIERGAETVVLLKTVAARLPELESALQELHPYEVPELLVLSVEGGASAYLEWLENATRTGSGG